MGILKNYADIQVENAQRFGFDEKLSAQKVMKYLIGSLFLIILSVLYALDGTLQESIFWKYVAEMALYSIIGAFVFFLISGIRNAGIRKVFVIASLFTYLIAGNIIVAMFKYHNALAVWALFYAFTILFFGLPSWFNIQIVKKRIKDGSIDPIPHNTL
jgi:hypothetical protein